MRGRACRCSYRIVSSRQEKTRANPCQRQACGTWFKKTVVKYQGAWRLYLNIQMRKNAGVDVGDPATVQLQFDPEPRRVSMHPKFTRTLRTNRKLRATFETLLPSRQNEILRSLNSLKTEESIVRNIERVRQHLLGKKPRQPSFLGRRK